MMDFIMVPTVIGIITLGIYKLFELFVCRKERIIMIEKLADRLNAEDVSNKFSIDLNYSNSRFSFTALKGGLLMLGIGLGLLVAFFICLNTFVNYTGSQGWAGDRMSGVVYGACVLLFGGMGLLAAFLIELKIQRKEKR